MNKQELLAKAKRAEMDGDLVKAKALREAALGKGQVAPVEESPQVFPIKGEIMKKPTFGLGSESGSQTSPLDETPESGDE